MASSSATIPFLPEEWSMIFFHLVCPSMGCLLATAMFAAPIKDLRSALLRQSLGDLNPRPWAVMTGNCLGWCAYAYYIHNPFILASNIPGLILSMWLNAGAAKLQYQQMTSTRNPVSTTSHRPAPLLHVQKEEEEDNDNEGNPDYYYNAAEHPRVLPPPIFTPQEVWWLSVMMIWCMTLVWVGWLCPWQTYQAATVGLLVNLNLIFFYGAPLQTMNAVIQSGHSNSIHPPSMFMACGNSAFWFLYGVALWDPVLMVPNSIGLSLGLGQVILCMIYPKKRNANMSSRGHQRSSSSSSSSSTSTNDISLTILPSNTPPDGIFRDLQLASNFRDNTNSDT